MTEVDVESGTSRVIAPVGPAAETWLSRDGRTLSIEYQVVDSDVWLLDYP